MGYCSMTWPLSVHKLDQGRHGGSFLHPTPDCPTVTDVHADIAQHPSLPLQYTGSGNRVCPDLAMRGWYFLAPGSNQVLPPPPIPLSYMILWCLPSGMGMHFGLQLPSIPSPTHLVCTFPRLAWPPLSLVFSCPPLTEANFYSQAFSLGPRDTGRCHPHLQRGKLRPRKSE